MEWYKADDGQTTTVEAMELVWILARQNVEEGNPGNEKQVPAWSGFNQRVSKSNPLKTTVGHLPIINAPAHDYDTIWTVVQNCKKMSENLGQSTTVMTFDEQIYCKAKMLQWHRPSACENVVFILGGFHVQMTFAKMIGKHMADSGLRDVWVESGVYGENTADNILRGKLWNRVIRAHKLTFEALWNILWSLFVQWTMDNQSSVSDEVEKLAGNLERGFNRDSDSLIEDSLGELLPHVQHLLHVVK